MSVCRSEVEFDGTVYKSVPDVAPSWENAVARGTLCVDADEAFCAGAINVASARARLKGSIFNALPFPSSLDIYGPWKEPETSALEIHGRVCC